MFAFMQESPIYDGIEYMKKYYTKSSALKKECLQSKNDLIEY